MSTQRSSRYRETALSVLREHDRSRNRHTTNDLIIRRSSTDFDQLANRSREYSLGLRDRKKSYQHQREESADNPQEIGLLLRDAYSGYYLSKTLSEHNKTAASDREPKKRVPKNFSYNKPEAPDPNLIEPTPAPNSYNIICDTIFGRMKKIRGPTLKGSHDFKIGGSDAPGPGQYLVEEQKRKNKQHCYSISKEQRFRENSSKRSEEVPGPGAYQIDKPAKIVGTYILKPANDTSATSVVLEAAPGPGKYNTLSDKPKGPRFRFGTEKRFTQRDKPEDTETVVGPLSYQPNFEAVRPRPARVKIGSEPKFPKEPAENSPGVGKYDSRLETLDSKGVKFSKQRRFIRKFGYV